MWSDGKDENCDGLVNDSPCRCPHRYRDPMETDMGMSTNEPVPNQPIWLDNIGNDVDGNANPGCWRLRSHWQRLWWCCRWSRCDQCCEHFLMRTEMTGDPSEVIVVCPLYQPSNYVEDNTDCDDVDATEPIQSWNGVWRRWRLWWDTDEDNGADPALVLRGTKILTGMDLGTDIFIGIVSNQELGAVGWRLWWLRLVDSSRCLTMYLRHRWKLRWDATAAFPPMICPIGSDSDGDGYGNSSFVIGLCEQPQNYVDNDLDCNDTDDWVHPENDQLHVDIDGPTLITESCAMAKWIVREWCAGWLTHWMTSWMTMEMVTSNVRWIWAVAVGRYFRDYWVRGLRWRKDVSLSERSWTLQWTLMTVIVGCLWYFPDEVDDDGDCFVECSGFVASQWEGEYIRVPIAIWIVRYWWKPRLLEEMIAMMMPRLPM